MGRAGEPAENGRGSVHTLASLSGEQQQQTEALTTATPISQTERKAVAVDTSQMRLLWSIVCR